MRLVGRCDLQAVDILSGVRSFCQGGTVYSVTIYASDYGKKRMVGELTWRHPQAEEEKYGPEGRIVNDQADFDEDVDDIEEEERINEDRASEIGE